MKIQDLDKLDEKFFLELEKDPENFENMNVEYKIMFDGNGAELRRDLIAFANGKSEGYLIFGISDDPISIEGIEKKEVDGLKTVINDVIPK